MELFINRIGNSPLEQLPIYFHPIQYFNNPELMIRISVKVLCLNLFQINTQSLVDLILNSEGEEFDFVNNWTRFNSETAEEYLSSITNNNETYLDPETLWFSLTDNLEFLNDILLTSTPKISNKFLKLNFQQIILPILQNSWTTKEGTKISLNELEYFKLINLILKSIKHQNMLNLVVFTLFYNELKTNMEDNAKVSETYFIDSKDDDLKELLNLTESEIEKSENLNPIYANNPTLITYITSQTPTESTTPLLIQIFNLLNLLVATYSKDINLKLLLKINLSPSRLTKDLLVAKLGINNNKEFNDYMNSNVKDKAWLVGLLEVNNNEAKKDDKDNTSSGSSCYWANLVFYNPELFNTLLNWLQNPLLLTYPKLSKIIKNLIIDLTYFPGIKYCLTKSDGLNLLDLFNSNKSTLAKNIPNLILKPLIWMAYFNYFKELEDNSTLTQNLLNSTSFPVESYLTSYSKLANDHLELLVQKLGKLTIPLKSTKHPTTNSEIIHLKKSTSKEYFSIGIRIPQNYPIIENLTLIPSKLPLLNFYKLQTTKFLKTQTLKLEYSFNLLELEFLPYLPENSSDKTLLIKNLSDGAGFNLIFLDFKECEYCRNLMFQKQLEVIEKVEKKLIRMMKLDLSTKLEDDEEDEDEDFDNGEDGDEVNIYEEFMQQ
ncbi:hypothetical protein CONCODRAFT_132305 [Conidiobolus coronatus NRRL 28638]|uniref:FPL domain-containing protein n=1 Tax=Conidiobolus coronatus (strain ATCC 28846 / CBS 209.66 / NRRL 28638) TaxID=796925 RepID=A0A137NTM6_CONC2|nr:hypothetical protein CONCODRAFT_132305 [Conidiobolus coronatus NRRL 28638]|eukprot:KXN66110.1 hypothetical protein CONCODRAFT_132305 [Conidiobolus coronatus NRRL 28638]